MDKRTCQLVFYLQKHDYTSSIQLADYLGVSERTIRSSISHANTLMNGVAHIVMNRGRGYSLSIDNQSLFSNIFSSQQNHREASMPQSAEERTAYLLSDLLNRNSWITLDEFASVLFVSRRTISNDLKQVEEILQRYHLNLVRRSHYGLRIEGTEVDRRLCLASLIVGNKNGYPEVGSPEDDRMIADVFACVDKVIAKEKIPLSTVALKCLVVHIVIAIKRIRCNCFVPTIPNSTNKTSSTYAIAQELTDELSHKFNILFPKAEVNYIAIHLAAKETLDKSLVANDLIISEGAWDIVSEMLDVVWKDFRFDFKNDIELRMDLACHIVPLSVRLRYGIPLSNPLLKDIKSHMPLAYLMAADSSSILVKKYGTILSEDEMGYVALSFALALERQRSELPKKHVLIVCASGMGTARILAVKVREEFGQYISSIRTCDVASLASTNLADIDYIFTTVPITIPVSVPICQANILFDGTNTHTVRQCLNRQKNTSNITKHFFEDLFFAHMTATNEQEALQFLSNALEQHEKLSGNFYSLVSQREKLARTSFGNKAAFPHPIRPIGKRTVVAVGLLDYPVDWSGLPVRAIFLSSFAEKDDGIRDFDRNMASFLLDEEAINSLLDHQSYDNLLNLLTHYSDASPEKLAPEQTATQTDVPITS